MPTRVFRYNAPPFRHAPLRLPAKLRRQPKSTRARVRFSLRAASFGQAWTPPVPKEEERVHRPDPSQRSGILLVDCEVGDVPAKLEALRMMKARLSGELW